MKVLYEGGEDSTCVSLIERRAATGARMRRASVTFRVGVFCCIAGIAFAADPQAGLEVEIAGVRLLDSNSTRHLLAGISPLEEYGRSRYRFVNVDRTEVIILDQHPGDEKFSIAEVMVESAGEDEAAPSFPGSSAHFKTARGIRLGMVRTRVLELLGRPSRQSADELEYSYTVEKGAAWLRSHNMPEYQSIFRFSGDRLVSFRFGFPYP